LRADPDPSLRLVRVRPEAGAGHLVTQRPSRCPALQGPTARVPGLATLIWPIAFCSGVPPAC